MRALRPIDFLVEGYTVRFDLDVRYFTDESMEPPNWQTGVMVETFFGRLTGYQARDWIRHTLDRRKIIIDGVPFDTPRFTGSDRRAWRLYDVERFARALGESGLLKIEQLTRILAQVLIIAETWGHLPESRIQVHVDDHDPARPEVYAMEEAYELVDDIDGAEGAQERRFALGDQEYLADLTDEHWNDLVAAMAPYVKVARRARQNPAISSVDRRLVRAWAKKNGYSISDRGTIPWDIMNAYLLNGGKT